MIRIAAAGRSATSLLACAALLHGIPVDAQRAKKRMPPVPIGNAGEWFPPDDYPMDALRASREGRVVADLGVDSGGRVVSCKIDQSSGTTSLDDKTCELVLARGRFDPATDAKGRPTASVYRLPVRWVIPDDTGSGGVRLVKIAKASEAFEVERVIGIDGTVESCRMLSRPEGVPDLCQQAPVGSRWNTRFGIGGEPVRAVVRNRYGQMVEQVKLPK